MRRSGIKRTSWLARHAGVRRRNSKRRTKNWLRAHESEERVLWIQSLPSVASGLTPCENAHVRSGGGSRKADACWIVPLTHAEHREELHQHGKAWFEAKYGISLDDEARRIDAEWQSLNGVRSA